MNQQKSWKSHRHTVKEKLDHGGDRVDLGDVHCVWAVNILNRFISKPNYLIC